MLYLIGLGLNENGISKEGLLAIEKSQKVYIENYTVDFPYSFEDLHLGKNKDKIIPIDRKEVESNMLIKEAKGRNVSLLIYGCPLFATTHLTLMRDAQEQDVKVKVIYAASVFDAVASTGLQLYKFGKVTSMPGWDIKKNYKPDSFLDIVKENNSIKAHSLILIDIGLSFEKAIKQLEEACSKKELQIKDKIIVCSRLGTEYEHIYYYSLENLANNKELANNIKLPFCIIIPGELHFLEKEYLENFEKRQE